MNRLGLGAGNPMNNGDTRCIVNKKLTGKSINWQQHKQLLIFNWFSLVLACIHNFFE